jgi:hypothetical protein
MSKELTFAGFAAMFRLGPEKITMTKADAVRLAEAAQLASDEIARLRAELATARKDALEEAAQFVETHTYVTTNSALKHKLVSYARAKRGLHHTTIAAAIRALAKGEGDD